MNLPKIGRISTILILSFPVFILAVKIYGSLVYVLLSVTGIYFMFRDKFSLSSNKIFSLFSWITLGYFLVLVLSVALSEEETNSWIHLSRKLQFLIAPLMFASVYRAGIKLESFVRAIKMGAIAIGLIVLGELILGIGGSRLSGMFNPNIFGDIAVFLTLFSISRVEMESGKEFYCTLLAFSLGIVAIVLSGSRGSMLLFLFLLFLFFLLMWYKSPHKSARYKITIVLGLVVFGSLYVQSNVITRMHTLNIEIEQWKSNKNMMTSGGQRLEMYRSGWLAYLDSPWIGYGYGNSNHVAARYVGDAKAKKQIPKYSHLHNVYITHMVNAGLLGLLSVLILFIAPLLVFIKYLFQKEHFTASLMGILLIVGYMSIGMVHSVIQEEYKNSFFLFFMAIFLIQITKETHVKKQ